MHPQPSAQARWARWILACTCALAAGCAALHGTQPPGAVPNPWAGQSAGGDAAWRHQPLPGKTPASYRYVRHEGRDALAATAESAASLMRAPLRVPAEDLGAIRFSWKVPQLIAEGDLGLREKSDSPVRVILAFEGDRSRFSLRDQLLSEMAHSLTGEPMPYATLMYVWCNRRDAGSVISNPRTGRIRKIVLESGTHRLNRWLDYERDIRADYRKAFGEEPGALVGIALMTDSDNTRSGAPAPPGAPLTCRAGHSRLAGNPF
jgi:hypothetical protein